MLLSPLHSLNYVLEAVIHAPIDHNLSTVEETEWSNTVVDLHHDNVSKVGDIAAVEVGIGVGVEPAALDEVQDREPGLCGGVGRGEDVREEAVLSYGEPQAWLVGKV